MASPETNTTANFETFRECASKAVLQRSEELEDQDRRKQKSRSKNHIAAWTESHDPEEMADFVDYIAAETFAALPDEVRSLSYSAMNGGHSKPLQKKYAEPLPQTTLDQLVAVTPVSVSDTLCTYGLIPEPSDMYRFLLPIFTEYLCAVTSPPPPWSSTKTSACEMCGRDWIPLTYHHLIPKAVHGKVLKRKWHEEYLLNSVAWLCRACHSFVHRMASNEELAREWYTVEKIMQREDAQDWVRWASRLRRKGK